MLLASGTSFASVGWANYQWPCNGASYADNQDITIYSQAWKGGCTDAFSPCPDLSATLYYKNASDPIFTPVPMTFNVDAGSNDEFQGTIPGSYTMAGDPLHYYIIWHDASDNTDYGPMMDHCGGAPLPEVVLNITPATAQDVTVTFRVDMVCLVTDLFSAGVFFAGDFQGWTACTSNMTDVDGDLIYEGTFVFPAGSNPYHEFKFNRSGTDGCQWENAIPNRSFTIDDSGPTQVLDIVPWDNWDCCTPNGPAEITGTGSWCITVCPCDEFLVIPLNTPYDPPIPTSIDFTPGCNTEACGFNDCTPGGGVPEWTVIHDEQGYWLLLSCIPRSYFHYYYGCFCMTIDQFLPVEFGTFDAVPGDNQVTLNWNTLSEIDFARFDVIRDGATVAQVPSQGNGSSGHHYSWTDHGVVNGTTYHYSLVAVDVDGSRTEVATVDATAHAELATEYMLSANYPNPFNPSTSIAYSLKEAGLVNLTVYDLAGRTVAELVNREQASGSYTVSFDGTGLSSGIYYYRLSVNGFTATQKMVLMK